MIKIILQTVIKIIDCINTRLKKKIIIRIKKFLLTLKADVVFVSEGKNWAIEWEGKQISQNFNKLGYIVVEIGSPKFIRKKIIHFGSINSLISADSLIKVKKSNKVLSLWYHIILNDERLKYVPLLNKYVDYIITPSPITKRILIESGLNKNKIRIIPIGVDLSYFKSYDNERKGKLRNKFELPQDKIIIGSFQKDGVGWGEGLEPKLVKGPDIFCELVKKIHKHFDIHIFLTGPARGYVKRNLEKFNIPYNHIFLKNYLDIVDCYNALDLYIVTSRAEGGPKALLEGMATGVPLITTNVGMAPYLIKNGVNGFITEVENVEQLHKCSVELLQNEDLKEKFIRNGLKIIQEYSWENIVKEYYLKLYKKFI